MNCLLATDCWNVKLNQIIEISSEVEIISTNEPCRLPYVKGELLLFISGNAYEYVQNFYQ
jgi:hypothetical protein